MWTMCAHLHKHTHAHVHSTQLYRTTNEKRTECAHPPAHARVTQAAAAAKPMYFYRRDV